MTDGKQAAQKAGRHAKNTASKVADHPFFEYLARAGFVMSGLVHAMIGWICIRLATGSSSGESADQSGALAEFASAPAGSALLIIGGVAMIALALMHVAEIFFQNGLQFDDKDTLVDNGKAAAKAVVYSALAFTALKFGFGSGSSSGDDAESVTSSFLQNSVGRILVILAGAAIVIVGLYHVYKGGTKKFKEDLNPAGDHNVSKGIEITGMVGYIAKGAALFGVGIMIAWSALSMDSDKARGMDAAFKEILTLPAGGAILIAMGVAFILYGVYSVLRAKYQEM